MRGNPRQEAERWIEQAEEDLRWARHLASQGGFYLACFLAQQIGEKALKAFLYSGGDEVVLGHSVERLCRQAAGRNPEFSDHCHQWAILDAFYVPTRYPNGLPDSIPARVFGQDAAREAVRLADAIVVFVRSRLS